MSSVVNGRTRGDRVVRAGKSVPTAKMRGRLVLDAALCALLVFAMLRPVTGQVVHEITGALLLVGMIAHVATSWGAASRTARHARETTRPQRAQGLLAVMVVLGVAGVALALSALVISRLLLGAGSHLSDLDAGHLWSRVHIVSAYVLCIAVLAHLVLYWTKGLRDLARKPCGGIFQAGPAGSLVCVCHSWRGACRAGWFGAQWIRDSSSVARSRACRADDDAGCRRARARMQTLRGTMRRGARARRTVRSGCRFPGRWRCGRFRRQHDARCADGEGEGASRECVGDVSARAPFCSRRIRRKVLRLSLVAEPLRRSSPRHPALALPGISGVRHSTLALPGLSGRNQPLATQHWHCQLFWRIEPYDSAESSQMGRIATCHENLPKWDDVFAST